VIRRTVAAGALLSITAAASAFAQDTSHVSLVGDLGFVNAAGNTSLTTPNAGKKLTYTKGAVTLGQRSAFSFAGLRSAADSLSFEGGIGATQQRSITQVSDSFTSARVAANYRHHLIDKAFISQFVEVRPDLQVTL
jgi:hypothetical protein